MLLFIRISLWSHICVCVVYFKLKEMQRLRIKKKIFRRSLSTGVFKVQQWYKNREYLSIVHNVMMWIWMLFPFNTSNHLIWTGAMYYTGRSGSGSGSLRVTDSDGREKFVCQTCGKLFLHQCNARRHRKQCQGDFHLQCHMCDKKFYRRDKYQYHLLTQHGVLDARKGTFKNII